MRKTALLLAILMLTAGCIGGDDGDDAEPADPNALEAGDGDATNVTGNTTGNATYLKNQDYNETHVHDYWPGDATQRVLMDETLQTNTFQSAFVTAFWPFIGGGARGSVGTVWFTLPNNTFVPEGTGELVVEVDATDALERGEISLAYQAANQNEATELDAQGAQATWTIELTPEMADLPHAKSTRWGFRLDASGNGAVLDGEFSVKVMAHKLYDLEAWPAHEDPWEAGAKETLSLFQSEDTFDIQDPTAWNIPTVESEDDEPIISFPEGVIVPPETRVLLVKFWYALDGDPKNNANADVMLRVKEGSTNGWYRGMWGDRIVNEPGHRVYAIEASSENWDSPYAEQSGWAFQLYTPTGVRDPQTGESMMYFGTSEAGSGNYTIDVTAHRSVPSWVQDVLEGDGDDDDDRRAGRG